MQVGYILFGIVPVLVSLANRAGWGASATVVARFVITCICVLGLAAATGQSLKSSNTRLLLMRGLFGGSAVMCYFVAVKETGAGMGTLLNNTHSIWANVLAVLVLGQRPFRGFWILLSIAVAGLWLVIDPSFDKLSWGELLGLLSGILAGAAILCVKELRKSESALTILLSFSVAGLLCGLPFYLYEVLQAPGGIPGYWRGAWDAIFHAGGPVQSSRILIGWLAILGVGLSSFAAQLLFTQGYKNTSVQLGSLISLTTPVIASFLGWFFLNEPLGIKFIIGAFLTLVACTLMARRESVAHQEAAG